MRDMRFRDLDLRSDRQHVFVSEHNGQIYMVTSTHIGYRVTPRFEERLRWLVPEVDVAGLRAFVDTDRIRLLETLEV